MSDSVEALVLDLLEWIGPEPRPYDEVLSAWHTSCPRLPVWEEANARGYVVRARSASGEVVIAVSEAGSTHLQAQRVGLPA